MEHITGERLWELLKRAETQIHRLGAGGIGKLTAEQRDELGLALCEFVPYAERLTAPDAEPANVYSRREQRSA